MVKDPLLFEEGKRGEFVELKKGRSEWNQDRAQNLDPWIAWRSSKMSYYKKWIPATLAACVLLPLGTFTPVTAKADTSTLTTGESTLLQVFDLFRDQHWSKIDEDKLLVGAVEGMLTVMDDPYTEYFTSDEYQQFVNTINQSYAGVGIGLLRKDDGSFVVNEVFPSTPAEAAGVKNGDQILTIEGHDLKNQSLQTVAGWVRGKAGSTLSLTLRRSGQADFTLNLTRKAIQLPSVYSKVLDGQTGYIRILSFSETAGTEFDQALSDLQRKGVQSIVLDLRGNGGGIVQSAVHIADRFLKSGLILDMRENNTDQLINADAEGVDLPLSILVDRGTASASEILAGSLQANKRAKLIGTRSFGKGVFQQGIPLKNGDVLKLTVGQYFFSDGSSPQKKGLTPDVSIQNPTLQLPVALESLHPDLKSQIRFDLKSNENWVNGLSTSGMHPIIYKGTSYVPLRFTMEALGSEVKWNGDVSSVSFTYKGNVVNIGTGNGIVTVNQVTMSADTPFIIQDGTSYLSTAALREVSSHLQLTENANQIQIEEK